MTITFVCRSSKVSKRNGLTPLELYVIIDGKRRYVSLNRKIDHKLFNPKKQIVRGDTETNKYIEAVRMKCYALETEMLKRGLLLTVDTFVYAFRHGIRQNSISVYGLFDKFMEKQLEKKDVGLITQAIYVKYRCTIRYCKEAMQTDKMLSDLTTSDMEDIYKYMLRKMSNNSAICYMRKLKTILIYAIREGYISTNPITFKFHKDKVEKEPLTLEEVRRIRTVKLGSRRIENIRDLFILQCYTGLAFRDMSCFSEKDIKIDKDGKEWIVKERIKTGITALIPILPVVKEILIKYNYHLPTLTNQKYNSYLKEIQDICGIKKTLHSHLARHTCGTLLLN
ncbi:MAG: site-specific integrase, partial [Alistipes sp.]|nr:site-specific integrase [Alistipes sp.]